MTRTTKLAAVFLTATLAISLVACSGADSGTPVTSADKTESATALKGSITVFAAASLKRTFTELADEFEAVNPNVTVELNFAGSSDLVTQITEGAPADVFASADEKNMAKLTNGGLISAAAPVDFATNVLEIAVPSANTAGVGSFADLAKPEVKTVICAAQVPCGAATVTVETATGINITPVSEESSVTDVLGKVTSGEADAGLVYVTDINAAGNSVKGIKFQESSAAVNTYPIAPVTASTKLDIAQAFIEFITGTVGQGVLANAGFGKP